MILVLDTRAPEVFFGLWQDKWLASDTFVGGRELNAQILGKLDQLFSQVEGCKDMQTCEERVAAIVVASGPGSFTGLRIGLSVANAFAYANNIPIVGVTNAKDNERLVAKGIKLLVGKTEFESSVEPEYGAEPNITKPKKQ